MRRRLITVLLSALPFVAGPLSAETIDQTRMIDRMLGDPPTELQFEPFDSQSGQRELVAVGLEFSGILDLEVLIQNYSESEWGRNDWYFDAGANVILAFDAKAGYADGGPFFGLGGTFIDDITGNLSAGSGGTPFDSPTPGDVDVVADTSVDVQSEVRTEENLDYFLAGPVDALTEPFLDFILTPPLEEPNAFIQGTAINLALVGELTLTYEYVERLGLPGDCNQDGVIDELDLACVCSSGASLEDLLETTGLVLGDLDADGEVGFSDFLSLSASFNSAGNYLDGDLNCDGMVEFADFLLMAENFGRTADATMANVPEATGFAVLLVGTICLTPFRRRRAGPARS